MLRDSEKIFARLISLVPEEIRSILLSNKVSYLQKEESGEIYKVIYTNGDVQYPRRYVPNFDFKLEKYDIVVFEAKDDSCWYIADLSQEKMYFIKDCKIESVKNKTENESWDTLDSLIRDVTMNTVPDIIDNEKMDALIDAVKKALALRGDDNVDIKFGEVGDLSESEIDIPDEVLDSIRSGKTIPIDFDEFSTSDVEYLAKKIIDMISSKTSPILNDDNTFFSLMKMMSPQQVQDLNPIIIFIEDTLEMSTDKICVSTRIYKNGYLKLGSLKLNGDYVIPKNASIVHVNTPEENPLFLVYNGEEVCAYTMGHKVRTWPPPKNIVTLADLAEYLKYETVKDIYRGGSMTMSRAKEILLSTKTSNIHSEEKLEDIENKVVDGVAKHINDYFEAIEDASDEEISNSPFDMLGEENFNSHDDIKQKEKPRNNHVEKKRPENEKGDDFNPPFKWDDTF